MGESACFVRSFSQPAEISSRGGSEGDPVRALTESISFGRFMSESLAWEKWSTFSHNRYLEEVEKLSKPGSVAQKKAFFEAHYKKRAAMKAAQTMLEEATVTTIDIPEGESVSETQKDTPINSEAPVMMSTSNITDEERQGEVSNTEADCGAEVNSGCSISKMDEMTIVEDAKVKDLNVEDSNMVENLEELENAENHFEMAVTEDKTQNEGNPASPGKERRVSSSSGSKANSGRLRPTFSRGRGSDSSLTRTEKDATSSSKKSLSSSKNQKRSMPESFHTSINSASSSGASKKKLLQMPQNSPGSSTSANAVGEADKKKRLVPSTVHMSINFACSARQAGKMSQKMLTNSTRAKATEEADKKKRSVPSSVHTSINFASFAHQAGKISQKRPIRSSTTQEATSSKAENNALPRGKASMGASRSQKRPLPSSLHVSINLGSHAGGTSKTSPRTAKDDPNSAKCSTRASVIGLSKFPPKDRLSEDKRKNTIIGSSISGRTYESPKMQSSVKREMLLSPNGAKARSSTVFSPFSFRSDERAEKRKEFFEKLKEKNKEKEAVKEQFPPRSKIPLTRPNSPRLSRNRSQGSNNDRTSDQHPRKFSSVKKTISPENARETCKDSKIHRSTSLPKKKTQENLSPNIQR